MIAAVFSKKVSKESVANEVELQTVCYENYGNCPQVIDVTEDDVLGYAVLHMERLDAVDLSEIWGHDGDSLDKIPDRIWQQIRHIVKTLLEDQCIHYVDITPYNFMLRGDPDGEDAKVFIIDFGHASYIGNPPRPPHWHVSRFIYDKENSWNPDFFTYKSGYPFPHPDDE